jgi:hypothetical protein
MATNSDQTEVLHSENHTRLSSEEIAKAVARHNKNHSAAREDNAAARAKNDEARARNASAKAKKTPKA